MTTGKAQPAITTTAAESGSVVGSATLTDTSPPTGGYNISGGTISFTLTDPNGNPVTLPATDATMTVTAAGNYTTPIGVPATVVGNYVWTASYSGDSDNLGAVEPSTGAEKIAETVTVSAGISLTTTPGGPVTLGSFTISGTKYLDPTGNGFSSDDTPQSGVTIDLYSGSCGRPRGTPVAATTTASNGTYSFTVSTPGTYYVQESVPSGYIQTGGGPNGTAGNTYYTIVATAGHSYSGYNFDDYQIPTCYAHQRLPTR